MTKLWHAFYSVTGCLLVLGLLCPMALAQQPQKRVSRLTMPLYQGAETRCPFGD